MASLYPQSSVFLGIRDTSRWDRNLTENTTVGFLIRGCLSFCRKQRNFYVNIFTFVLTVQFMKKTLHCLVLIHPLRSQSSEGSIHIVMHSLF